MLQVVTLRGAALFLKIANMEADILKKKRNPGAMSYEKMLKKKQCIVTIKNGFRLNRSPPF